MKKASEGFSRLELESDDSPRWRRILLKLTGEMFAGPAGYGIDGARIPEIVKDIRSVWRRGIQFGIVVGAGNIFRGGTNKLEYLDRPTADEMGMLGTVLNGLVLQSAFQAQHVPARVMSAISISQVCEPFVRQKARSCLKQSEVVISVGGIGNPLFSTDTAAALRATELHCDAIFKGTQVDGVYDSDPRTNPKAKRYEHVSYRKALAENLGVMDSAALSVARNAGIPIIVFKLEGDSSIEKAVCGEGQFTVISDKDDEGE